MEGWKLLSDPATFQAKGVNLMKQSAPILYPRGLRTLRAYQLAKQLANLIYNLTTNFPKNEFRLVSQMRDAAVSVFGNIAEGYGRNAVGDYIRFCEIARGSLTELGSYIEFSQERKFLKLTDESQLLDLYNQTWNTLGALIGALQEKKLDGSWNRTLKEEGESYDV